jgi:WD repeat-containing protein 7
MIIPAGRHYLSCVFVDRTQILLAYANGKARVWDFETLEFRRSTGFDSAQEMLADGEWTEM